MQETMALICFRMIAMLMVVVLHILGKGGVLSACEPLSGQYELLWFLEIAARVIAMR